MHNENCLGGALGVVLDEDGVADLFPAELPELLAQQVVEEARRVRGAVDRLQLLVECAGVKTERCCCLRDFVVQPHDEGLGLVRWRLNKRRGHVRDRHVPTLGQAENVRYP